MVHFAQGKPAVVHFDFATLPSLTGKVKSKFQKQPMHRIKKHNNKRARNHTTVRPPIEGLNHRKKRIEIALLIMWFRLKVANIICKVVRLVRFWTVRDITGTVIGKLLLIFHYLFILFLSSKANAVY